MRKNKLKEIFKKGGSAINGWLQIPNSFTAELMANQNWDSLTLDMQLIPLSHTLDFAFLPIGDNCTMGIEDACKAAKLIECKEVVGMHFDTFPPIEINHKEAIETFKKNDVHLTLPVINQTIAL